MKKIETIFKDRIFLGKLDGENVWLAPPSWDCGWYWGFGYIQNRNMHTHYEGRGVTKSENYDFEKTAKDIGKHIEIKIIGDILEIKSLNKINKIIIKYNEILISIKLLTFSQSGLPYGGNHNDLS